MIVVEQKLVSTAFEGLKFEKISLSLKHGGRQMLFTRAYIFLHPLLNCGTENIKAIKVNCFFDSYKSFNIKRIENEIHLGFGWYLSSFSFLQDTSGFRNGSPIGNLISNFTENVVFRKNEQIRDNAIRSVHVFNSVNSITNRAPLDIYLPIQETLDFS